jgi:hypothetical protein
MEVLGAQRRVLDDARLSRCAQLFFCRLACDPAWRLGWGVQDAGWTPDERVSLRELRDAGHIQLLNGAAYLSDEGNEHHGR